MMQEVQGLIEPFVDTRNSVVHDDDAESQGVRRCV